MHSGLDISDSDIQGKSVVASKSGTIVKVFSGCCNYNGKKTNVSCSSIIGCACHNLTRIGSVDYCNYGYGNALIIQHGNNSYSQYAHFDSIIVSKNQIVKQDDVIGYIGSTGESSVTHLHFSLSTSELAGDRYDNNPNIIDYIYELPPTQYTVTFDPQGGNCSESNRSVNANTAIGSLPTPTWNVHRRFKGWFSAASGGNQINQNTIIQADKTIYAQWLADVTVTFYRNDNSSTSQPIVEYRFPGDTYGTFPVVTRFGNRFLGWPPNVDGTKILSTNDIVSASPQDLYAHWEALTIKISYRPTRGHFPEGTEMPVLTGTFSPDDPGYQMGQIVPQRNHFFTIS